MLWVFNSICMLSTPLISSYKIIINAIIKIYYKFFQMIYCFLVMEYSYEQKVRIADAYLNSRSFISLNKKRNNDVWAKIILSQNKEDLVENLYGGSCCLFHFKSYAAIKKIK